MSAPCEHQFHTQGFVPRKKSVCTLEAAFEGRDLDTGDRVRVCEGHSHYVRDPKPLAR